MEPTHGAYDAKDVDGMSELTDRMADAESIKDWSFILADYISFGNNKIAKNTAIFNMNSATDCPNADTSEDNQSGTGMCQVPFEDCYAHRAENQYPAVRPYRRRQEYLWDCLDADTWAAAFEEMVSRKRNDVKAIRFSEAGDFRHRGDIIKVDRIAELLEDYDIYTYSASHKLDWSEAQHFVVNQSNNLADYGDRLFTAVPTAEDIPENGVQCANEASDGNIKCGECTMCYDTKAPDVYISLH